MIREYIQENVASHSTLTADKTLRGTINAMIKASVASWSEDKSVVIASDLRSLVDYEVHMYMTNRSNTSDKAVATLEAGSAAKAKTTKNTKKKRTRGVLTVVGINPPTGQLEDSTVINFSTVYPVLMGERLTYTYNPTTGLYNVDASSKGKINPLYGRQDGGLTLSEQMGRVFYDQNPNKKTSTSVKTARSSFSCLSIKKALALRLGNNLIGQIQDGVYYEYKTKKNTSGLGFDANTYDVVDTEITMSLDVSTLTAVTGSEQLTVSKYILHKNCVIALLLRHTPISNYANAASDLETKQRYSVRHGEAYVYGEIIIIHRAKQTASKVTVTKHTATNQIYYAGFIDMIVDKTSGNLILAKLSDTQVTNALNYTAITYTAKKEDIHPPRTIPNPIPEGYTPPPPWIDKVFRKEVDFNRWIANGYYGNGTQTSPYSGSGYHPDQMWLTPAGSKSWDLKFPTLDVSTYKLNATDLTLTKDKELFIDSNPILNSKHDKTVAGGYIHCMLFQDQFDKDKTLYIAREYDAWMQFPIPDDFTFKPIVTSTRTMSRDDRKYVWDPFPSEIVGFFGIEYFQIAADKSATKLADIPGGTCRARSAFIDDTAPGYASWASNEISTVDALYILNDYVKSEYITTVETHSIYNTFIGGPGQAETSVLYRNMHCTYGQGLMTHTQRFAVIREKEDKEKRLLVIAGSWEPVNYIPIVPALNTELSCFTETYHSWFNLHSTATCGLYSHKIGNTQVVEGKTIYTIGNSASNIIFKAITNNLPHATWYMAGSGFTPSDWYAQFTMYSGRADIVILDASTFYMAFTVFVHQFDWYVSSYYGTYWDGYIWFISNRQLWENSNGALSGWVTDDIWNSSLSSPGATNLTGEQDFPSLHYY